MTWLDYVVRAVRKASPDAHGDKPSYNAVTPIRHAAGVKVQNAGN